MDNILNFKENTPAASEQGGGLQAEREDSMASASINDLLRRTALALAAAAASLFAVPALALTVTLNNTTGSSCTYTGITTDPSGNVQVNCQTTGGTGPGTFSVSMQASATVGTTSVNATVSRNSGSTGQVIVTYNIAGTGTGCASPATGSTLTFADGSTGSQMIVVTLGANAGDTCTVTITGVDNSATIGTGSATVTLAAAGCVRRAVTLELLIVLDA